MKTKIVKINKDNIEKTIQEAVQIIKDNKLVIFPTETVYGIGANALDENASKKIYNAKGRPSDNPLIVHIADFDDLKKLSIEIDERTKKIVDEFWPGPLTIIVKKPDIIPYTTTGGLDTVAIRMPLNNIARQIISQSKLPIAAPSANISGRPSITSEDFIQEEFDSTVDMIILDNSTLIGIESTVIDTTGEKISILRPGFITKSQIEKVIGQEVISNELLENEYITPKSPGMKYTHYSPNCEIYIVDGDIMTKTYKVKTHMQKDKKNGIKVCVMAKEEYHNLFEDFISLGKNDLEIAKNIFNIFRQLDKDNFKKAYFLSMYETELELSIMDRMKKASGYKVI